MATDEKNPKPEPKVRKRPVWLRRLKANMKGRSTSL